MKNDVIRKDPRIQGGAPVFAGTRVPVKNLFDYLQTGENPRSVPTRLSLGGPCQGDRNSGDGTGSLVRECASCLMSRCHAD